jgi:phosphate:Na+ symporter
MGAGVALAGFGLLFTGLDLISRSAEVFRTQEWFTRLLLRDANRPVAGILYGAFATMLIQSSTLLVGLVMSFADQGAVTLQGAVHLVLGSNIGTAIPTLVAGLALGPTGRRMAYVNLLFNLFGVLLFLPWLKPFVDFVASTSPVPIRQVANSHGLFNLLTAVVGLPLVGPWSRRLDRSLPPSRRPYVTGRTILKGRKG